MAETAAVREYVLDTHEELLETVLVCADGVTESWDGEVTTERRAVVEPFERALDSSGILDRLPAVLVGAVRALGEELPAEPVPAPPYVAITSLGPVLRATLDAGRLVITIYAFDIERGPTRYVRGPTDPADALTVELKSR
jgi:hypothetical protein